MTDRYEHIRSKLHEHFVEDLEIPMYEMSLLEWHVRLADRDHTLGPTAIAGWAWPCWEEETTNIVTLFCPERIRQVTEDLSDEELDDYLIVLDYMCDLHIALWDEVDPWKRHRQILDEVSTQFPGSLDLLQSVGLKAAA